jgi:hypothetical protein
LSRRKVRVFLMCFSHIFRQSKCWKWVSSKGNIATIVSANFQRIGFGALESVKTLILN